MINKGLEFYNGYQKPILALGNTEDDFVSAEISRIEDDIPELDFAYLTSTIATQQFSFGFVNRNKNPEKDLKKYINKSEVVLGTLDNDFRKLWVRANMLHDQADKLIEHPDSTKSETQNLIRVSHLKQRSVYLANTFADFLRLRAEPYIAQFTKINPKELFVFSNFEVIIYV